MSKKGRLDLDLDLDRIRTNVQASGQGYEGG
jgi:hypothetical protein